MSSNRQTYGLVDDEDRRGRLVATSKVTMGRGDYEVHIRYRGPSGRWSSAEISGDGHVRADISKTRNFIPDVEIANKADENLKVRVCLDIS